MKSSGPKIRFLVGFCPFFLGTALVPARSCHSYKPGAGQTRKSPIFFTFSDVLVEDQACRKAGGALVAPQLPGTRQHPPGTQVVLGCGGTRARGATSPGVPQQGPSTVPSSPVEKQPVSPPGSRLGSSCGAEGAQPGVMCRGCRVPGNAVEVTARGEQEHGGGLAQAGSARRGDCPWGNQHQAGSDPAPCPGQRERGNQG